MNKVPIIYQTGEEKTRFSTVFLNFKLENVLTGGSHRARVVSFRRGDVRIPLED